MNISPNRNNYQAYSFTGGLTKALSSGLYRTDVKINDIMNAYPKANNMVGSIPFGWIKDIPKVDRKDAIKYAYMTFGDIADTIRTINIENLMMKGLSDSPIKRAETQIMDELKNDRAFKINVQDVKYFDSGAYGDVFVVKVKEGDETKKYAMKIFKYIQTVGASKHGNMIEQNRALFLQRFLKKEMPSAKMHFADLKNGYMLSEFIDSDKKNVLNKFNPSQAGLCLGDDSSFNRKQGYMVDLGGVSFCPLIKNYTRFFRKNMELRKTPENLRHAKWEKMFDRMLKKQEDPVELAINVSVLPKKARMEAFDKVLEYANTRPEYERKKITDTLRGVYFPSFYAY